MASSSANKDDDEKLASVFALVSRMVSESSETAMASTETRLLLYGLFKRVANGACETEPPPVYHVTAYAKHKAWMTSSKLSKSEAMQAYVDLVAQQTQSTVGREARRLVENLREENNVLPATTGEDQTATPSSPIQRDTQNAKQRRTSDSFVPIIPRGRLDIAYTDLLFATMHCFMSSINRLQDHRYYEQKIINLWQQSLGENVGIVPGLSARSLLDLYLRAKKYSPGSQIIMSPPITVPGIEEVLQQHQIEIVPVDLPVHDGSDPLIAVDCGAIENALTGKTVAIMVVHVFGMLTASSNDMKRIHLLCRSRGLDLIEDCAECFEGLPESEKDTSTYLGSPYSDIVLFSFGLIKTATALGGGVAVVRDVDTHDSMNRLLSACYRERQSTWVYFSKICKAYLLLLATDHPAIYGLIVYFFRRIGLNFESFATTLLRGFKNASGMNGDYLSQIRLIPCSTMFALALRRMRQRKCTVEVVSARRKHSRHLVQALQSQRKVTVPRFLDDVELHACWLFPVLSENPQDLCHYLLLRGLDATRGASQLRCVGDHDTCPRSYRVMEQIMYLPMSNRVHTSSVRWMNSLPQLLNHSGTDKESALDTLSTGSYSPFLSFWVGLSLVFLLSCAPLANFLIPLSIVTVYAVVALILATQFLRWKISSFYLENSNAFAQYSYMFNSASKFDKSGVWGPNVLDDSLLDNIIDKTVLDADFTVEPKRSILLTGATGFVGSMILRDFLRHRELYSIKRIYVIIRSKGGLSADERMLRLLQSPIFSSLPKDDVFTTVQVIRGDTSQANAGLAAEDLEMLKKERFVSHVYNCAATVSFTQTLKEAAISNITSVLNLQGLAAQLPYEEIKFVHISTAFVHGNQTGTRENPLGDNLFDMAPYDPFEVYKSMNGAQYYATKAMGDLGFSNVYQLSKCVAEHLLKNSSMDTIIIRPSIVGPAASESLAGWAGSKPSTITAAPCLYFSYQWNIWSFGDHLVPCVPVDVLARFITNKTIHPRSVLSAESEDRSLSSEEDYQKVSCDTDSNVAWKPRFTIYNAAWDVSSPASSQFTWLQFASAITQVGVVLGYFGLTTAYLGLWIATRAVSRKVSLARFKRLHQIFVESSFNALVCFCAFFGHSLDNEKNLRRVLDLPVLFFPFMNSSFFFSSDLVAPQEFNGEHYMILCLSSASSFLQQGKSRCGHDTIKVSMLNVAGSEQCSWIQACFWASMQPRGSLVTRIAGLLLRKLLSSVFSGVVVDLGSFCDLIREAKCNSDSKRIILAPTHRSFFDFLLLSYVCFSIPEMGVELPYIIAADDFERLPVIGLVTKLLGAIFVRRGRGRKDPSLEADLDALSPSSVIEVFIEGTRSRDRRFVHPKTGVLRYLTTKNENCCIVPITISYEKIPEQLSLVDDIISNGSTSDLSTQGLFSWVAAAASGKIQLGKVFLSAAEAVTLPTHEGVERTASVIQRRQASQVLLSIYHLSALAHVLDLPVTIIEKALCELGCRFWLPLGGGYSPPIPSDHDEIWTVALQASPYLAPLFHTSRPLWAKWLFLHVDNTVDKTVMENDSVSTVMLALQHCFDAATKCVKDALVQLSKGGFLKPSASHILQIVSKTKKSPRVLVKAAISMEVSNCSEAIPLAEKTPISIGESLSSGERLGFWGFKDSFFVVKADEHGSTYVTMDGERYPYAGKRLSKLIPFLQKETGLRVNLLNDSFQDDPDSQSPLSTLSSKGKTMLQGYSWKVSFEDAERIRHGSGHSLADVLDVRHRSTFRVPDAVVWPSSEDEVVELIRIARSQNWCLIPYGGGTNVSQATKCPSTKVEPRPIISVDMGEMRQVLFIDEENGVAHVQCGITGRELVQEMKRYGYTIGHEPDSYEFSTLGGWIATKASGMKRSKYGNIEDIVISIRVAGPEGMLTHDSESNKFPVWGRESTGLELLSVMLGSEGCLGIFTSAVIRIWPLSKVQDHDSILFSSFDHGLSFVRDVQRIGPRGPASIRLLDNDHFRLGRALQPSSDSILESIRRNAGEVFLKWKKNFDSNSMVCTTILYEGSQEEVDLQRRTLKKLISLHGGLSLGATVGRQGYNFTFLIAYLRDFALTYNFLGDSFESFVPWSKIKPVVHSVKDRIRKEHAQRFLPGYPFVGCRVTQLYHEGVCLYFYFSMSGENVTNPSEKFLEIEHAAREEILRLGGSLSHHHGIGKARSAFVNELDSLHWSNAKRNLKRVLDPDNIFGARNGSFGDHGSG